MSYRMTTDRMTDILNKEPIYTWFDLGIFLDRLRETKPIPTARFEGTYEEFVQEISENALAFITFHYSVDGVTVEIEKYEKILRHNFNKTKIHYIGGKFFPESEKRIDPRVKKLELPEINGFEQWKLYKKFYFTRLERGSEEYNQLITDFWKEVLQIVKKLGKYIENNNIRLLYLINICSNPGNVSLALATVLISEYMGIPVINNNHDFYWEGGNREIDKEVNNLKKGPRDFFFTNAHLGEVFSIIEVLFPWESRSWINVNINKEQSAHLISQSGHNPANVTEIGTAVDTHVYLNISKRQKINAYDQFEKILSRYKSALVCYSVSDVINNNLVDEYNPRPLLIGFKTRPLENFLNENIIFLQPTRIITRKRIELGFKLIKRMFTNKLFIERLKRTSNLKITILVTGPIALGHHEYFKKLIKRFSQLLEFLDEPFKNRVFLAFLFSEIDKKDFKEKFKEPVGIPELYNIASLVLLPSRTEGRGLPIIEATACGTPIFCRRYFPENVYSEVIGENLPEQDRLKVIEFDGKKITSRHSEKIINRVMFPHKFTNEVLHNKQVVQKRFSLEALNDNIETICRMLHYQLGTNEPYMQKARIALEMYKKKLEFSNDDLKKILKTGNRQYLPGYGRLAFMLNLESLIDPSSFRKEEQQIRGFAHNFAKKLLIENKLEDEISKKKEAEFFNTVDNLFHYHKGKVKVLHDHSFSYRHRNKNYYPYQDYTIQEITGIITYLFFEILTPKIRNVIDESSHFFTDWDLALAQLTSSAFLAIDDRRELIHKMQANIPIGIFPGEYVKYLLEFFALQAVRSRLKIKIENELTDKILEKTKVSLAPVYVFAPERSIGKWFSKEDIVDYIENGHEHELKILYRHGILQIIDTKQLCIGIHFPQIGEEALRALAKIHDKQGFIVSNRTHASMMTDIVDIDRFHIGKASLPLHANILGIPQDSGYIQFVPAGIRTTLSYPTPIQTAKDFNMVLKSRKFKELTSKFGERKLFKILLEDAETQGSPARYVLEKLQDSGKDDRYVKYRYVSGIYEDNYPWNGVFASINLKEYKWRFKTLMNSEKPKKVTSFVANFYRSTGIRPRIAWNGGYILNPELVGKLGLPESYIGSPLGLLITDGKTICPPLFNKAALLIDKEGKLNIHKVNSKSGITFTMAGTSISFSNNDYNVKTPGDRPCYYDLLYSEENINAENRTIVRLAGNTIKEIIYPGDHKTVRIIPVGLTLSFPVNQFPESWKSGDKTFEIIIKGMENILHAVEAGPFLVAEGKATIDMHDEGWDHFNSIKTQAARIDYTDMRGPKIAVGLDNKGVLSVLTINGRIRESVGATHSDMAKIMIQMGIDKAMGFDPGGSSTLVVEGKTVNISPYNHQYEKNIYALPPEPRAVSNAIIGYVEE